MRGTRVLLLAAIIAVTASPVRPEGPLPAVLNILGSVTNSARPVGQALVIALDLTDFDAVQTYTAPDGSFSLPSLPGGIYKLIAVKTGYVPATMTVVPTKADHRVNFRLNAQKQARATTNQEIWEIRGSLPPDILRELDAMLGQPEIVPYQVPRVRGEMVSMTALANETTAPAFAQTGVGVQSRIGETWQIGIRGDMLRVEDRTDGPTFGNPLAEASTMEMELRSSPTDAYRLASTRSSWRYGPNESGREAGLRSHNFEWEHGQARVKVRYLEQDNLFRATPFGSDTIEIAGDTPLMQTRRSDLGVSLRVRQETVRSSALDTLHTADVAANGRFSVVPSLIIHYGMGSRFGVDRSELAPRTGFEWKMTGATSVVASGAYKFLNEAPSANLPSLVLWADDMSVLPRYSYSFGIVSTRDEQNRLSAIATVSAADSPMRVVFADGHQQFWDGLYVDSGDVRRDVRVSYRREFGKGFAIDVATTAGMATPHQRGEAQKVYVTGDLQTIITPTRTTLAISYREIQQPQSDGAGDYRGARVNLRMAQSLYLPIDVRLLLGLEVGQAENSPFLLDMFVSDETSTKYIGGLAVNF